jgi:hypothetical protein
VYLALNEGANIEEFNDKIADFVKSRTGDSLRTLSTRRYSDAYLYICMATMKMGCRQVVE